MEAASLNQVASSTTEYESRTAVHAPLRSGVISYKFALVSLDVLVALAVALAEIGFADHFSSSFRQLLLICVCATPIVFFPTFNLYSYHRIFSRRYHLSGLVKTFAYSLLTFGVLALNYEWTGFAPSRFVPPGGGRVGAGPADISAHVRGSDIRAAEVIRSGMPCDRRSRDHRAP